MLAAMKAIALLLALLTTAGSAAAALETPGPAADAPVYVIPVHGQIEGALLYVLRRGFAEA